MGCAEPRSTIEPVEHRMRLLEPYFDLVIEGRKTIEVRVADHKRRQVRTGDRIVFRRGESEITTTVTDICAYESFVELLRHEDNDSVDPTSTTQEKLLGLKEIYPPDKEELGVLAFHLRVDEQSG